ncbi:MAG: cupin domain-containing protein [Planctomycetota bacterium]|jgi:mannose-6-phosphate isomerase-like protein (cupin superfamily)
MLIRSLAECSQFIAGDGSLLRELLHPGKADVRIRYSLAHATVPPGEATRPHRLKTSEVYYIIAGTGTMVIDESQPVRPGDAIYIPPGATQYIQTTGRVDLVFLCIVDPAWQPEDEEVLTD